MSKPTTGLEVSKGKAPSYYNSTSYGSNTTIPVGNGSGASRPPNNQQSWLCSRFGITPLIRGILIGFALGVFTSGVQEQINLNNQLKNAAEACQAKNSRSSSSSQQPQPQQCKPCDCDCTKTTAQTPKQQQDSSSAAHYSTAPVTTAPPFPSSPLVTNDPYLKLARGLIQPLERSSPVRDYLPGKHTDTYTYFHHYMNQFGQLSPLSPKDFTDLPMLHIWPSFFEAYHNHWSRYRGKSNIVFMEIGVQSGGKIPLLRDYFGPGFQYIGIDINPSCKKFEICRLDTYRNW